MMSYLLFAGLSSVIYIGLAYVESVSFGHSSSYTAFLSNVLAALFLFSARRLLQMDSYRIGRACA